MFFESVNHKVRASELRTSARELERAGFPIMAEVNWELAEWLDPTPREETRKPPRRTRAVNQCSQEEDSGYRQERTGGPRQADHNIEVGRLGVNHNARREARNERRAPRGTSVDGHNRNGRILRQTGRN